jgi:hypothetical protein
LNQRLRAAHLLAGRHPLRTAMEHAHRLVLDTAHELQASARFARDCAAETRRTNADTRARLAVTRARAADLRHRAVAVSARSGPAG